MKLSNLRLCQGGGKTRVMCDVDCGFSQAKELYFEVDDEYEDWLTADVYDAFLVAALYPCQCYNEPIEIDGKVTKRIYLNALNYVEASIIGYRPGFYKVPISVKGYASAEQRDVLHVGTGFSGGVDSFSTLQDWHFGTNDPEYKIDTLFFFHVGQYGNIRNPKTHIRADQRFTITKGFAQLIGCNAVMMNTNLFEYYQPRWEYDAGVFCRILSILVFQRALRRYYVSNGVTYAETMACHNLHVDMAEHVDPYMMYLLSTPQTEIICEGAQHSRTEKVANIANNPFAHKYLNVCVNTDDSLTDAKNCGYCGKCMRTQMALESLDALDTFSKVFDKNVYYKHAFTYKCQQVAKYKKDPFAKDNVDFAKAHGKKLPPRWIAFTWFAIGRIRSKLGRIKRKILR